MNTDYIYLASPYSVTTPTSNPEQLLEQRFQKICKIAGTLMCRGYVIYCPIAESHMIQKIMGPKMDGGWDMWQKQDIPKLHHAKELWVVMMDGWDQSVGIQAEIDYAREQGKPIYYIDEDGFDVEGFGFIRATV